jgi:fructokinase
MLAGVELGGTKCIAVLAEGNRIVEQVTVPTTLPDETLGTLNAQLRAWHARTPFAALGIASFGPVRLDPAAPDYGCILRTPKPGWSHAPVAARLAQGLPCNWEIDTDVNAAAQAETLWGAGKGYESVCYVTIGTGVGAGIIVGGQAVHGALHPEVGHLRLRRAAGDVFPGTCSFHGDCIEGLISGPALEQRFGKSPASVADDDPVWRDVASDLSELVGAILLTTSAQRILFGGSVARSRSFLLPSVRRLTIERLGGYLPDLSDRQAAEMIRLAALEESSGPLGAIALVHKSG